VVAPAASSKGKCNTGVLAVIADAARRPASGSVVVLALEARIPDGRAGSPINNAMAARIKPTWGHLISVSFIFVSFM
jgi:hypothetical protein